MQDGGRIFSVPCEWWVPVKPEVVAMVQERWETTKVEENRFISH